MNKHEIQNQLTESHVQFTQFIQNLQKDEFNFSYNFKWTAGQQLEHIIKSVKPVNTAFHLPSFLLKMLFGKANRPSRTFEALVERYQQKLAEGGKSTARFLPAEVAFDQREKLINQLTNLINSLTHQLNNYSESQLDQMVLPHPLLGKLTLREMLCFTIYHVGHHGKQARENLQKRSTQE
jgi:hypothetical protein